MKCKLQECDRLVSKKGVLYCCIECSKKGQVLSRSLVMNQIKEKRKQTNLERYGVENTGQSTILRNKYKKTNLERYGVDNPLKSIEIKERIKATNLEKYGVENYQLKDIPLNIIMDPTWLIQQHHTNGKSITKISSELGIDQTTLCRYYHNNDIEIKKHYRSGFELDLVEYIQSHGIDVEINKNNIIYPYEIDIFIPEKNLAIECNGVYWHTENRGRNNKYHLNKTIECNKKNIHLVHIYDIEYENSRDIVLSRISNLLGISKKIHARKCSIKVLTKEEEKAFFNQTHIQGFVGSKVCLGLVHNGIIVSAMSFGKPRFDKNIQWELLRFSNILYTSVVGGASKLLNKFIINYDPKNIKSYSDKRWSTGNLYNQLGFKNLGASLPNYWYTRDYKVLENRLKFQKHKLSKLVENFNPLLTEWENMKNNGYDRIWDCGNDVWVLPENQNY